jgi:hypothetical protein
MLLPYKHSKLCCLSHSVSLMMNCYVVFSDDVAASYKFYTDIFNMEPYLLHITPHRAT